MNSNAATLSAPADGGQPRLHIFHHSCALKKDEGPCKAVKDRFYFDIDSGRCESFEYGGCQGNANNFQTLDQCEEMCVVKGKSLHTSSLHCELFKFTPPEPCLSPVDRGNCDRLERRYAFNPRVKRCQMFQYSGCGGNRNNFLHKRHCMKTCTPDHSRLRQIRIKTKNSNILFRSI
uniref:BPTI/Kunitz inhibitor domain-containing protein n=1 Tax=Astyanax mexicanus TaxID=7994 RepID=A0A8B9H4C5_ASTMX